MNVVLIFNYLKAIKIEVRTYYMFVNSLLPTNAQLTYRSNGHLQKMASQGGHSYKE